MSINIKNPEVETLLNYIVEQTGETKTEAVRVALLERYQRLVHQAVSLSREEHLRRFLEEVWPLVPERERGRRLSKEEEETILGLGELGV
ncbi:MAG TPA: protein transcription factor [Anaerolineae bacterium]|nr:protein transcription factor [Anaerolineae bacterium]